MCRKCLCIVKCRLTENWTSAVKFEQVYLDFVKTSELKEKETLIEESNKRLQEYNQKLVFKMSMRSILG